MMPFLGWVFFFSLSTMAAGDNVADVSLHLDKLFEDGLLNYKPDADDGPDVDEILKHTDGVVRLMETMPSLNGRWSLFVKAILVKMRNNTMIGITSEMALGEQMRIAEEQGQMIRILLRHIKREWYRVAGNSKLAPRWWMAAFPRQLEPAVAATVSSAASSGPPAPPAAVTAAATPPPLAAAAASTTPPSSASSSNVAASASSSNVKDACAWGFHYFDDAGADNSSNESTFDYEH